MTDDDQTPAADRVTALTLRCGQLREQRDEARAGRDGARWERDMYREQRDRARAERDEARAQVVACQTAADDLRALADEWKRLATPATRRSLDACATQLHAVLDATTPARRAGSVHRAETGASAGDSVSPDPLGPQIGAEQ